MTTHGRPRKTALDLVKETATLLEQLRMQTAAQEQIFRGEIRSALAEGEPVAAIAAAAGISRERVYQIRDDRR